MNKGFYDPIWDNDDHFVEVRASKIKEDQYTSWVLGFLVGVVTAVMGSAFVLWIILQ